MFVRALLLAASVFSLTSCATSQAPERAPQAIALETAMPAVTLSDGESLTMTLSQWMEALSIPGVSVAVINDYEIAWAEGFGVADAERGVAMTRDTVLQAGSIAKPVTAMAALRFVERGALTLDADINASLNSWQLPASEFTTETPVTLRRLLAHTSGITPGGFGGYEPGAALPTLVQILNGAPPANSPAAIVQQRPNEAMQYSGLAYTIVQATLIDRSNETFPALMRENVLAPLRMNSSSFEQPAPRALAARLAAGYTYDGSALEGRFRLHPEMAAAGLWTTPSDLAQIAIEMSLAREGRSTRVLSQAMAERMLTEEMNGSALGWMVGTDGMFWHNGGTEGFRAHMRMFSARGDGIVLMSNSDNGNDLLAPITNAISTAYNWPLSPRTVQPSVLVRLIASQRGVERAISEYAWLRENRTELRFSPGDLNGWGYALLGRGRAADAVRVFTENVRYYAENGYAYDSLAEGMLAAGDREGAIRNYRRSLELVPDNDNARAALARLEADAN